MKRQAVASPAGSISVNGRRRGLFGLLCVWILGLTVLVANGGLPAEAATDPCPNAQYRVGPAAHLPECRAYEMVSPANKNAGDILPIATQAKPSGGSIYYQSLQGFGDLQGAGASVPYVATRGGGGWGTHAIAPRPGAPVLAINLPGYHGLSDDLSRGVYWTLAQQLPGDEFTTANIYRVEAGTLDMERLSTSVNPVSEMFFPESSEPGFAGGTPDLSRVVFESRMNRTAGASGSNLKIYEWANGGLRLVNILPDPGGPTSEGLHARMPHVDNTFLPEQSVREGGVSRDGSRIFFQVTAAGNTDYQNSWGDLYVREDGQSTTDIGALAGPGQSLFWRAEREHGEWVLFADGEGLYRYDLEAEELTEIASSGEDVLGASDDGQRVYFTSATALEPNAPNDSAVKLYLYDHGSYRYLGSLDFAEEFGENYVSPDGRFLVTRKKTKLTSYDNQTVPEVYLYDADVNGGAGEMLCPSCDTADGDPPTGITGGVTARGAGVYPTHFMTNAASAVTSLSHRPLGIWGEGDDARTFFSTRDALVDADVNGKWDVYVYEVATGSPRLITTGQSNSNSWFSDASVNGDVAFFTTREPLVGWDVDGNADLYAARVGGGLPEPPPSPPLCDGDACQPPPRAPSSQTPASSAFSGPGSPKSSTRPRKAKRCAKGKRRVKARGKTRCVPKKSKKGKSRKSSQGRGK